MKRKVLLLAVLTAFVLVVGMSVSAQDTLVIWADGERAPLLTELGAQFEEEFGIAVDVQQMGLGDARDQLLVAGPVGEGPDILVSAHDSLGQFVANGAIVPLNRADLEDMYTEAGLDLFTFNGELYGVPYAIENVALIRNVDLVPERPETWQEVRALAEQFQADGTAEYAFLVQTGNTYHNYPITTAFGGYIFGRNDDGSYNTADVGLNSEGGLAAGQWLSGMYTDGLMAPDVNDDVVFELFTAGEAAMIVTGPWFSGRIVEAAEAGGFEYSVDRLPGAEGVTDFGQPFAGGQGFVISAFSENQLLAETFLLDFVSTLDFHQSVYDNASGSRFPTFVGVDTSSDPNIEFFIDAGFNAVPMPAIPEMSAVWSASDNALTLISQGGDSNEAYNTAVDQIASAIQEQAGAAGLTVLVGSLQSEIGCAEDWNPACTESALTDDDGDGVFTGTFSLPAGEYEFKVALNGSWDVNYGADGAENGANIPLVLEADSEVTFSFDDASNVITAEVAE